MRGRIAFARNVILSEAKNLGLIYINFPKKMDLRCFAPLNMTELLIEMSCGDSN